MQANTESSVVGAALSEPGLWLAESGRVYPEMFVEHHQLGVALCEMRDRAIDTDPQSVHAYLASKGVTTPLADLIELGELAPASHAGLKAAIATLGDRAKRRALARLGQLISDMANDARSRPGDLADQAARKLAEIDSRGTSGVVTLSHILPGVIAELGRPLKAGVKTGLATLDRVTGGFRPGELVILGARPSMGKTALASGIARHAILTGKSVALFSLEMGAEQIAHRLLADAGNVDLARVTQHRLGQKDLDSLVGAAAKLHKTKLHIGEDDLGLAQACARIKQSGGLDLAIVDYVQLMRAEANNRQEEIASLSRMLKLTARKLRIPILALSQLNRQIEQRACKRPQLSDLRESGALEQDADKVLLLWREAYYDPDADPAAAEIVIAKQRNGPVGTLPLHWEETRARFTAENPK